MPSTKGTWLGTLLWSVLWFALASGAEAQATIDPAEPRAGAWKTWVLASGSALRLPAPPDAQATASELQELRTLARQRDAATLERIRHWDFWSPSHRWNELFADVAAQNFGLGGAGGIRALAMLNVAIHDAMIAAWDSKYAHNRRRPGVADPQLGSAIPTPRSPSYPCEHSVAAGAAAAVLSHLFPKDSQRFAEAAEGAARSRVMAGVVYSRATRGPGSIWAERSPPACSSTSRRTGRNGRERCRSVPGSGRGPARWRRGRAVETVRPHRGAPAPAWPAPGRRLSLSARPSWPR